MAISHEYPSRGQSYATMVTLEDRFELVREIGDGSFGSVALARVRTAGANVARRGTMVAIKTMKKTFDSFAPCLELREVIFLRTLPTHAHLVPALDIFLDPMSKKLHIAMEYMEGNLYQLMKARDHKCLDSSVVKSILFQILSGLEHIHAHQFFHRDIKPENILVTTSAPTESNSSFRRYSSLMTPPATPPTYTIKIADFGLARETHSHHPYTTYVSTRWYRAPEVLLRAGEYSAPVDIWALGAMAVEIANLKPLFPGGNEVDQVWRVCEIMGSPGNWYDKNNNKVGGGEWREGTRLAQKLGFSFPKMAPHSMETILRPPQWPPAFSNFITQCLMWDPKVRPTSHEALRHEYFTDAVDPLRPKSSRVLTNKNKHTSVDSKAQRESTDMIPGLTSHRSSWFRKSVVRDPSPAVVQQPNIATKPPPSPRPAPVHAKTTSIDVTPEPTANNSSTSKYRPFGNKRATWTNGSAPTNAAPMPILPSIRPISPFSNTVTAQAHNNQAQASGTPAATPLESKPSKKIGRQLSIQSNGNHYAEIHRQETERALNGQSGIASPMEQKEGFFSHLRKRARRLSGKPHMPATPAADDIEATAGCSPWQSNRNSMMLDSNGINNMDTILEKSLDSVDQKLQITQTPAKLPLSPSPSPEAPSSHKFMSDLQAPAKTPERHPLLSKSASTPSFDSSAMSSSAAANAASTRTRRTVNRSSQQQYDTPDEQDELLHEALTSAHTAARRMDRAQRAPAQQQQHHQQQKPVTQSETAYNPYPTPSPSAKRNGMLFDQTMMAQPLTPSNVSKSRPKELPTHRWPTPPYEENEWAASVFAAASSAAAGSVYQ